MIGLEEIQSTKNENHYVIKMIDHYCHDQVAYADKSITIARIRTCSFLGQINVIKTSKMQTS